MTTNFDLDQGLAALRRTPVVLRAWLSGMPQAWTQNNEGPDTWSPYDIVGHLIHGEKTDWIPRAKHILSGDTETPFEPFDRSAHFRESQGKTLEELLDTLERLRAESIATLEGMRLEDHHLALRGAHPAFGSVTLGQLLATWVAHDLNHLAQVARVMAFQLKDQVGPWQQYLKILGG